MSKRGGDVPERLQFTIAGIGIELTWEGARLAREAGQIFYHGFLSNGHRDGPHRQSDVRLHLQCGDLPDITPEAMIFDAVQNNRWRLFQADGRDASRLVFEFFHPHPPHPRIQLAIMAPDFRSGELYRRPDKTFPRRAWSLSQLMRPFGELLLLNLLSQGRGVLVHGLAVCDHGEGWLFIGRSGAGKSTLANLYKPHQDVTILGDERVVVTQADGQFWLSGTPWPGEGFTVSAETVPLRKVFFLEHGARNRLIPDRFLPLYGLFFQQVFLPFWNGEGLAFAMRFTEELLSAVPTSRLAFVNDARVIEFLREQRKHGTAAKD